MGKKKKGLTRNGVQKSIERTNKLRDKNNPKPPKRIVYWGAVALLVLMVIGAGLVVASRIPKPF
jgi:hypothetical protein